MDTKQMDIKPNKKKNLKIVEPIKIKVKRKKKLKIVEPIKMKKKKKLKIVEPAPAPEPPAKLPFSLLFNEVFGDANIRQNIFKMKKPTLYENSVYIGPPYLVKQLKAFIKKKTSKNAIKLIDSLELEVSDDDDLINSLMVIKTGKMAPLEDGEDYALFADNTLEITPTLYTKEVEYPFNDDEDYPTISDIFDYEYEMVARPLWDNGSLMLGLKDYNDDLTTFDADYWTMTTPFFVKQIKDYLEEAKTIYNDAVELKYLEDNVDYDDY
jgi:hypothetical protein